MMIVRKSRPGDLDAVFKLAGQIGPGMTTFKADRVALARRLAISAASFAGIASARDCDYLFVMEDCSNGRVAGVCAIKGAVGLDEPFCSYRVGTSVQSSAQVNVLSNMETLQLSHDMTGAAELCSLYLHPDYRNGVNGKLLSKSRFLFIAQFPHLFCEKIFAEMRGYQTPDACSPFWDGLGRHFFKMDFHEADDLRGQGQMPFIAQLMPRHLLYTHFLSAEARAAIGQTHVDTVPARRLLEQEGLRYEGYVDAFDGGPVLQARVGDLRACRDSTLARLQPGAAKGGVLTLVATTSMRDFRVAAVFAEPENGSLMLPQEQLDTMQCQAGAAVRVLPLAARRAGLAAERAPAMAT